MLITIVLVISILGGFVNLVRTGPLYAATIATDVLAFAMLFASIVRLLGRDRDTRVPAGCSR